MSTRRPFEVALVGVLAFLLGAVQLLTGVVLVIAGAIALGILAIVIGSLTIIVTFGILAGRPGSRLVATVVLLLNVGSGIYVAFAQEDQRWSAVIGIVLAVLVLGLLYTPRSNRFFGN